MKPKAGVFCHNGLGDGVNTLVLSENLHRNGWDVQTYNNAIGPLQKWFPHLPVEPYPEMDQIESILSTYDWFFVVHNNSSPFVLNLISEGKKRFPKKMKVIYLYPSKNIVNEPFYADCLTDPSKSVAHNMCGICKKVLGLPNVEKANGFTPLPELVFQKHPKRVVIHPTSSRNAETWPKDQFVKLALHLEKMGYEPFFVPGTKIENWRDIPNVLEFSDLSDLASFIYESGSLIGNDSGLGHLAAAVGIPTVTICRRKTVAKLWAPGLATNIVITPSSLIPNIRGLRLRDRKWKSLITLRKVLRGFNKLRSLL